MGTANTVVTNDTKNVLLWVEANDAQKIRFTSMTHAIRTQAAVLNEKHVDPTLGLEAIQRAAFFALELAQGSIGSKLYDNNAAPIKPQPISLETKKLKAYTGIDLESHRIETILKNLGFAVTYNTQFGLEKFIVTPPSYRASDVTIAQDVVEEISRIWGYHNFPSVVMDTAIPDKPDDHNFSLEYQMKSWLSGWGAQEVYTYSMVSGALAVQSGFALSDHITIKNPLSDEYVHLRRSLLPSLAEVLHKNPKGQQALFELQNIYTPQEGDEAALPQELLTLAVMVPESYVKLKGIIEALLEKLHIEYECVPDTDLFSGSLDPNTIAHIRSKQGLTLGTMGRLRSNLASATYAAELDFAALEKLHRLYPHALKLATNPPIIEDLTFTLPPNTYVGKVSATIRDTSSLIEAVKIKSTYLQNVTFTITYRSQSENLSNEMIEPLRKAIIQAVLQAHAGKLVGEV